MPETTAGLNLFALLVQIVSVFVVPYYSEVGQRHLWDASGGSKECALWLHGYAVLADVIGFFSLLVNCCYDKDEPCCNVCCGGHLHVCWWGCFIAGICKIVGCVIFGLFQKHFCLSCCATVVSGVFSFCACSTCYDYIKRQQKRGLLPR